MAAVTSNHLRRVLSLLALVAAAGVAVFLWMAHGGHGAAPKPPSAMNSSAMQPPRPAKPPAPQASTQTESNVAAGQLAEAGPTTFPRVAVAPATPFLLGSADTPPAMDPATVLGNMRIAIQQHGSRFGGNPVGTNPEITKALNGENPKQVRFLTEESGLRINARGELVDYWGTPFFFHQLSGTEMEIRSAGPDRVMWTADDLVTR
jgi:hypothetical protein